MIAIGVATCSLWKECKTKDDAMMSNKSIEHHISNIVMLIFKSETALRTQRRLCSFSRSSSAFAFHDVIAKRECDPYLYSSYRKSLIEKHSGIEVQDQRCIAV
jgi:hypothetical protein